MDFFSSIKNAYDSIGSEISKTFDSSDFEKEAKKSTEGESLTDSEPSNTLQSTPTKSQGGADQTSVYTTPTGGRDDSWGQWEERDTPTHREKVVQAKSTRSQASPVTTGKDGTDGEVKVPVATSTPAKQSKGKSSLESLSREDLLKYVRKQALLLQKSKAKCDELSKECEELKHATPTSDETAPTSGVLEELVIVRSERDKAVGEGKSLQQSLTEMTREKQDLSDEVQALTEANGKLKEFCQEHQSLKAEMEELKQSCKSVGEERDQLREEMEGLRQSEKSMGEERDRLREEIKGLKRSSQSVNEERDQLREEIQGVKHSEQSVIEERDSLSREVSGLRDEVETGRRTLSDKEATVRELSERVDQLEESGSQLEKERVGQSALVEQLTRRLEESEAASSLSQERSSDEWRAQVERLEACLTDKSSTVSDLETKLTLLSDRELQQGRENETLCKQLSHSNTKLQELESKLQDVEQSSDLVRSQLSDAVSKLDSTQAELSTVCEARASLESELEALRALHQTQSAAHERLCVELEDLKLHSQTLSEDSDDVARQRDEDSNEVARLQDECQQLTDTVSKLEGQLDKVKGQLEAEKSEMTAALKKEKEAHKEEGKKLKALVLKLKKELKEKESTSIEGDKALREELEQVRVTMETVISEKEQLMTRLAQEDHRHHELEGQIQELTAQLSTAQRKEAEFQETSDQLQQSRDELVSRVTSLEESGELMSSELASVQADLATAQSLVNTHQLAAEKLEQEVSVLQGELEREKQAHCGTRDQLVDAEKGVKSSALMNLELEDYQRSIRSLEEELASRDASLESVRRESQLHMDKVQRLTKELESSGSQRAQEVETVNKLKALLVKNKKELSESRKRETESVERVEELMADMERERGAAEESKVQLSELSARLHTEQMQHQVAMETVEATVRGLELRTATLQSELSSAQASLTIVQGDYDSYKVRVHSVLKQKASAAEQVEINPEIKKRYEDEIIRLKSELQDTKSQLSATLTDHEELLSEHDALTSRHDQLLQDAQGTRERLTLRLKEAESQHSRESEEQGELVSQLRREMEELTVAFTSQISGLQQEHKKVVVGLREELHSAHSQLSRLQEEADSKVLVRSASHETRSVVKPRRELEVKVGEPPTETRTSGVGMDRSELESSYPSTPLSREDSSVSLERLLTLSSEAGGVVSEREAGLQRRVVAAGRKVEHLTELLRESEASSVRLSEQAKLLKEEIRRLERNQEREGVSNMEYLKNVILKFLHTRVVTEKEGLVPVITKLLQLSPQEVKFVQEAIQGEVESDGPPGSAVTPQGVGGATSKLSNYIHRWTGY